MATLAKGVGAVGGGQQRQQAAEGEPGVGVAVQEDDRLPVRVALGDVVDLRAAGEPRSRKPKLRNLLLHDCLPWRFRPLRQDADSAAALAPDRRLLGPSGATTLGGTQGRLR
jgi:hypothetical protein